VTHKPALLVAVLFVFASGALLTACSDVYDTPPSISAEPSPVDFGVSQAGAGILTQNIVLTNNDARDASLLAIAVDGDSEYFAVTSTGGTEVQLPVLLQPQQST